MEIANANQPANPENKQLLIGQFADAIVAHILQTTKGDLCVATSVANLVKMRLETEYRFLLERQLQAAVAAKFDGQHDQHSTPQ